MRDPANAEKVVTGVASFGWKDVVRKARELVAVSALSPFAKGCGEYCPFCALAEAKTMLEGDDPGDLTPGHVIEELARGIFIDLPSDRPLLDAKNMVMGAMRCIYKDDDEDWESFQPFTQRESMAILDRVLDPKPEGEKEP